MSKVGREFRSYLSIEENDLRRLLQIARADLGSYFREYPEWGALYSVRVLVFALGQGAAKHYVDGKTGINDFDVYTFFEVNPLKDWYAKRIKSYDFGDPKFGVSKDRPDYVGRRVDCLGRSIEKLPSESAEAAIIRYLADGRTETARLLARRPVVLLKPSLGKVLWIPRQKTRSLPPANPAQAENE